MTAPLVSVIIPTYNCGEYLQKALASVLEQSGVSIEVVLVDSSGDDSCASIAKRADSSVRYIFQEPRGVSAARNLGIQHAQGELIAFQDADDEWLPEKLMMQVDALQRHPDAGQVFTDTLMFRDGAVVQDALGRKMLQSWCQTHRTQIPDVYYGVLYRELLSGNCMNTSSVVIHRKVLDEAGIFDETLKIGEDYDLWLRIARNHPVVFIDRVFCKYRVRDDGLSGGLEVCSRRWLEAHTAVREKHLRFNWVPGQYHDSLNDVLSDNYWELGWNCFSEERFKEARTYFLKGLRYRPLHFKNWLYWCSSFLPFRVIETVRSIKQVYQNQTK